MIPGILSQFRLVPWNLLLVGNNLSRQAEFYKPGCKRVTVRSKQDRTDGHWDFAAFHSDIDEHSGRFQPAMVATVKQ